MPGVERAHPLLDLERGAAGAERVVLVRLGDAEHPDDGVADELLDRAAVPLERRPGGVEVGAHQLEHGLRVGALAHRRRPGQVAEHRGHELAPLDRRRRQRGAAAVAEPRPLAVLRPASRTASHQSRTLRHGGAGVDRRAVARSVQLPTQLLPADGSRA